MSARLDKINLVKEKGMDDRTLRVLEYNKIIGMLANYAQSAPGREMVLNLKPIADRELIVKWLQETSEAESITAVEGTGFISPFQDVRQQLRKAKIGSILSPKELLQIGQVLALIGTVKARMNEHKEKSQLLVIPSMISRMVSQTVLLKNIQRCIENEENLYDYASPELNNIRRQIGRANDRIRERLNSFLHSPTTLKYLQDPIITMRNGRYVIPVKVEHRPNVPGIIHDQSSSGATLFIEPMSVVEANNEVRQLMIKEEEEIERILAELTAEVEVVAEDVQFALDTLIKLDFIFSKGAFSLSIRGTSPRIVDSPSIKVINGRHPLIDKNVVVPITIELGREFNALVITGPNTGGKTVTIKTAGLFVLMTQSGLHLPADFGSELGIFNNVYADIGDEQSIEQSLSTFSSHMTNIVRILSDVDMGDLVLFDELGAGTDPTEGAALAMSILDHLHSEQIRVMATTHYSELKIYALTQDGVENASVEFDVETLRPTYRLLTGIPGKSNAFEISRRLGLTEPLINGAKEYLSQEDVRFEDIVSNIEKNRVAAENERQQAKVYLEEIQALKAKHEDAKAEFELTKSKLLTKAKEEARRVVRDAKAETDQIIKELRQIAQESEEKERNKAIEESRRKMKDTLGKLEENMYIKPSNSLKKPPKNLQLGEAVHIVNLDQKGQVLSLPDGDGNVMVQVGIMKVNVHISNLRRTDENTSSETKSNRRVKIRMASVALELDLRGQNSEDAIMLTDRYLDDAFLAGLNEVTIIHGKGTGVLRNSIQQLLKQHSHVEAFRLGKYGEGESGVTVVTLK